MNIRPGDKSEQVKYIQEWLYYWKKAVEINSEFDTPTSESIKCFQKSNKLEITGIVKNDTWLKLNAPLNDLDHLPGTNGSLNSVIVSYALRHYKLKPIEIGGANCGPFVRYYMKGVEGLYWGCGFVSTIIIQSFTTLKISPYNKFRYQTDCNELYKDASTFLTLDSNPSVGSLFISYNPSNTCKCLHTGIVIKVDIKNGLIITIEGGSRDNFEVTSRTRTINNKYFISLS